MKNEVKQGKDVHNDPYIKKELVDLHFQLEYDQQEKLASNDDFREPSSVVSVKPFTFWNYIQGELMRGEYQDVSGIKGDNVYNFLRVPKEVEKLIMFGYFICLDSFLYVIAILPISFILAWIVWMHGIGKKFHEHVFGQREDGRGKPKLTYPQKCDLLKGLLMIVSSMILQQIDPSRLYHVVRGQSIIKLYVIFNVVEVFNRLFCSFGQDILDSLFSETNEAKIKRGEHLKPLPHFILAVVYVFAHAMILFYQLIALNVAVNSYNNALLPMLLSNQFYEIKTSVFKKFEKENLFQLSCSDIVERFELSIFLVIVTIRNLSELPDIVSMDFFINFVAINIFLVFISECIVDWIKHAFVTKFNHISPQMYSKYIDILCKDLTMQPENQFGDHSPTVSRRIGHVPYPLCCLVIRSATQFFFMFNFRWTWSTCLGIILAFACILALKMLIGIVLKGIASERNLELIQRGITPSFNKEETDYLQPNKLISLDNIERFTLFKNRIP